MKQHKKTEVEFSDGILFCPVCDNDKELGDSEEGNPSIYQNQLIDNIQCPKCKTHIVTIYNLILTKVCFNYDGKKYHKINQRVLSPFSNISESCPCCEKFDFALSAFEITDFGIVNPNGWGVNQEGKCDCSNQFLRNYLPVLSHVLSSPEKINAQEFINSL